MRFSCATGVMQGLSAIQPTASLSTNIVSCFQPHLSSYISNPEPSNRRTLALPSISHTAISTGSDTTTKATDMPYSILLVLEPQSCRAIHALRTRYQQPPEFIVSVLRGLVYKGSNLELLIKHLPRLASEQSPFNMEFSNPHVSKTTKSFATKYILGSPELKAMKRLIHNTFESAMIFNPSKEDRKPSHSTIILRQYFAKFPSAYHPDVTVPVKSRIHDQLEADRILKEIKKLDVGDLGTPRAIGFQIEFRCRQLDACGMGEFYPFLCKKLSIHPFTG